MWNDLIEEFCAKPLVSQNLQVLVRNGSQVEIVKYIEEINDQVLNHLRSNPAKKNHCYVNAWELAKAVPDVNYIEGFLRAKFTYYTQSVTHAWCEYKGMHFDITPLNRFHYKMGLLHTVHHFSFYRVSHNDLLQKDQAYHSRNTETFCVADIL